MSFIKNTEAVEQKKSIQQVQPDYKKTSGKDVRKDPYETSKPAFSFKSGIDLKKENRRNIILNTIQKRGSVNIKDVSAVIKDCSEKTVQRELLNLVDEGVLKKEGERRWSVYSLTQ